MNRLQKKCLIASASCHGLLLLVLLVGPAFFISRDRADSPQVLNMVPAAVIDGASSGGTPNAREAAPPPAANPPQPQIEQPPKPPEPPVKPAEPVKQAEPPKPVERSKPTPPTTEFTPVVKPPKTAPVKPAKPDEFDFVQHRTTPDTSKSTPDKTADLKQKQAAENKQIAEKNRQIASAVSGIAGLTKDLSTSGIVEFNGKGGDPNSAVADYGDIVYTRYYNAWVTPMGVANPSASTIVRVTVARDGRVTASEIVKRSGDASMDKSIQNTLNNVTFILPFPPNSKDLERTYMIQFDFSKRASG